MNEANLPSIYRLKIYFIPFECQVPKLESEEAGGKLWFPSIGEYTDTIFKLIRLLNCDQIREIYFLKVVGEHIIKSLDETDYLHIPFVPTPHSDLMNHPESNIEFPVSYKPNNSE